MFIYAQMLYNINQKISELLILNSSCLSETSRKDVIEILFHLDVWSIRWDNEVCIKNPKINDIFTFDNDVTFPKDSVERLLSSEKLKH
tara:strand:+ start:867 stop:1130 length:264 start_codon:yes stop_codon:yes gene_type:complete